MINENLRKLRIYNKYTQEDIADRLGVSRQSVAKWENGETMPDINKCVELARLYDVTLDDLVKTITNSKNEIVTPKGKYMFGVVKVGERGQIVIPKKAREVFEIKAGDRLLILGDTEFGIGIKKCEDIENFFYEMMNSPIIEEDLDEGN